MAGITLIFKNLIAGVTVASLGALAAVVLGLALRSKTTIGGNKAALQAEYDRLYGEAQGYENAALTFTSKYIEGSAAEAIEIIAKRLFEYDMLGQSIKSREDELTKLSSQKNALINEITPFFQKFVGDMPQNFNAALQNLREATAEFVKATTEAESLKQRLIEMPEVDVAEALSTKDIPLLKTEESNILQKLDSLREEMGITSKRISEISATSDRLADLESQLEDTEQSKQEAEKSLAIINKTAELLTAARENLSGKYLSVMREGFGRYADELGINIGEYLINGDLEINIDRKGLREKDYFSVGYKDMLDICMRLALIDALYSGEKPPLILDDPFVNLDDGRTEKALLLLERLSDNGQIIYLTCHSSRMPK